MLVPHQSVTQFFSTSLTSDIYFVWLSSHAEMDFHEPSHSQELFSVTKLTYTNLFLKINKYYESEWSDRVDLIYYTRRFSVVTFTVPFCIVVQTTYYFPIKECNQCLLDPFYWQMFWPLLGLAKWFSLDYSENYIKTIHIDKIHYFRYRKTVIKFRI